MAPVGTPGSDLHQQMALLVNFGRAGCLTVDTGHFGTETQLLLLLSGKLQQLYWWFSLLAGLSGTQVRCSIPTGCPTVVPVSGRALLLPLQPPALGSKGGSWGHTASSSLPQNSGGQSLLQALRYGGLRCCFCLCLASLCFSPFIYSARGREKEE